MFFFGILFLLIGVGVFMPGHFLSFFDYKEKMYSTREPGDPRVKLIIGIVSVIVGIALLFLDAYVGA
jgi:hypothetical protein